MARAISIERALPIGDGRLPGSMGRQPLTDMEQRLQTLCLLLRRRVPPRVRHGDGDLGRE